jgi:pyruvate dehydrogenase (quinone)
MSRAFARRQLAVAGLLGKRWGMVTVAETIVDSVARLGVRHIWGIVGDALNPLSDAVRQHGDVDWVGVRHEEAGAFAAGAQAQLTGGLGVCAGTVGPGSVHLLNGLYDAAKSRTPLLALCGQVPLTELGSDFFQEVDNDALFAGVARFARTLTHPAQLPFLLEQAVRAAVDERGVAVLTLPQDLVGADLPTSPTPLRLPPAGAPVPDPVLLDSVAEVLTAAGTVTLLVGIGAAHARDDVIRLAERLAAPMVVTLRGKDAFEGGHGFDVGQSGLLGNPGAAHAIESCDVLLMLGTDFPYREYYPDRARVIQIDTRPAAIGRRTSVDLGVVGDAGAAVRGLLERLAPKPDRSHLNAAIDRYRDWRNGQERLADPAYDDRLAGRLRSALDNRDGPRIRPEVLAAAIDRHAAADAVFTVDTGMTTAWVARLVTMHDDRRLLGSFNLGSMATALPQAIGAQALDGGRQVIACCGDGGLTMLLGELVTVARYRLPVKIVVFDNEQYGMVMLEQEAAGQPAFGTDLADGDRPAGAGDHPDDGRSGGSDLAAVARALGIHAVRVTEAADVDAAVADALARPGPVLLDVVTNPDEIAVPPSVHPGQVMGFAVGKLKEAVRGG